MAATFRQIAQRMQGKLHDPAATTTLHELIAALDGDNKHFDLRSLYELNLQDFELAMTLITDWRFRRYTQHRSSLRDLLAHA
jgi:hypothetical protein